MLALLTAIQAAFTTNATLTAAFPGGLWREQAPEDAVAGKIYLVSTVITGAIDLGYVSTRSSPLIQFAAYGRNHDVVGAAMDALTAALDNQILTLAGNTMVDTRRLGEPIPSLMPHDEQGDDYWRWMCQYLFSINL